MGFQGANYFESCLMLSGRASFCAGMNWLWRNRTPRKRQVLLRLRKQMLPRKEIQKMNPEEREWKK